jgi:hypothetical protein
MSLFLRGDYGAGADPSRDAYIRNRCEKGASVLRDYVMDSLIPDQSRMYGYGDPFGAGLLRTELLTDALADVDWDELRTAFLTD